MKHHKHIAGGFTLVELSIVLVIVGLIIGAVIGGQALIKAAEVRNIMAEVERYQGAIVDFEDKYKSLPGDMVDASSFWTASNGDGDGMIEWSNTEGVYGWLHLEEAGFIEAGGMSGAGANAIIDTNVPGSRYQGGGYYLDYDASTIGNHLGFGRADGAGVNDAGVVDPAYANQIDTKLDDGLPEAGRVRAGGSGTTCVYSSAYNFTTTSEACYLEFQLNTTL